MSDAGKQFNILCGGQSVIVNFITRLGDQEPAKFSLNMLMNIFNNLDRINYHTA
jgi:hypothetical protein